jgi:dephospho-CoA kinase
MGTGKSTVAELLTAFGAELIDFDQLARQALLPESPGWSQTVELFGPKIVNADQTLDRAKIASVIFKKPLIRQALEDIVHPLAWDLMRQKLVSLKDSPLIIIDVPLLFEANLNSLFHPIIVSFAAFETQYQRLRARDPHRSRSLTKKMIRAQMPIAEKIRLADAIINNSGSLVQLIRQTKELWRRLTKM